MPVTIKNRHRTSVNCHLPLLLNHQNVLSGGHSNPHSKSSPAVGFRLSQSERRTITRNADSRTTQMPSLSSQPIPTENRFSILGTSAAVLPIKAAPNKFALSQSHRVYVGNLLPDSSEDDLREYITHIGVQCNDIVDVFELKPRRPLSQRDRCSFCVSLSTRHAFDQLFRPEMWPEGAIIRPYHPAIPKRRHKPSMNDRRHHSAPSFANEEDRRRRQSPQNRRRRNDEPRYDSQDCYAAHNRARSMRYEHDYRRNDNDRRYARVNDSERDQRR